MLGQPAAHKIALRALSRYRYVRSLMRSLQNLNLFEDRGDRVRCGHMAHGFCGPFCFSTVSLLAKTLTLLALCSVEGMRTTEGASIDEATLRLRGMAISRCLVLASGSIGSGGASKRDCTHIENPSLAVFSLSVYCYHTAQKSSLMKVLRKICDAPDYRLTHENETGQASATISHATNEILIRRVCQLQSYMATKHRRDYRTRPFY